MRLHAMAALMLVPLAATLATQRDWFGEIVAPPASPRSQHASTPAPGAEQAYLVALAPHLDVVIGEGKLLADLGQARSRNVLELSVRMDRYREASAALQAFVAANTPPPSLEAMMVELSAQLAAAEAAIAASISAIRGFDWDALETSVDEFSTSVRAIESLSAATR